MACGKEVALNAIIEMVSILDNCLYPKLDNITLLYKSYIKPLKHFLFKSPLQINSSDCGVFVCICARIAIEKLSKHVTPSIVGLYRDVLRNELTTNTLV